MCITEREWLEEYYEEGVTEGNMTEWEWLETLRQIQDGVKIPAPSLSELEGDEVDPWDY